MHFNFWNGQAQFRLNYSYANSVCMKKCFLKNPMNKCRKKSKWIFYGITSKTIRFSTDKILQRCYSYSTTVLQQQIRDVQKRHSVYLRFRTLTHLQCEVWYAVSMRSMRSSTLQGRPLIFIAVHANWLYIFNSP